MSVRMSPEMFGTPFWITLQPLRVIWGVSWSSAWLMIALSFLVHAWGHMAWVDSGDCSLELWRYCVTPSGNLVGFSQAEWCASVGPPMVAGDPACVPSAVPPQTQTVSVVSRCQPYLLCFFVFPWKNSKLAIPTQTRLLRSEITECNLDSFVFSDFKKLACSLSISAFFGELAFMV